LEPCPTQPGNQAGFLERAAAILVVSCLFRSVDMPEAGKVLGVLVILVFILADGGLENKFLTQLKAGTGSPADLKTSDSAQNSAAPLTNIAPAA
jgi:hypothetical protein